MIKLKQIIEDIELHEGLEITHPLSTAVNMLQNWGTWDSKKNVLYMIYENKLIIVTIIRITEKEFQHLLKIANNMGYYPSALVSQFESGKYDEKKSLDLIQMGIPFYLKLEAKYDQEINFKGILYHATDESHREKILKIGLVPKAKEKILKHPDRIYFTFQKEDVVSFADNPVSQIKNLVIFQVDLSKSYKVIRLFKDPRTDGRGVYTYQNIPPNCLSTIN